MEDTKVTSDRRALAERVRRACLLAAAAAYEQAREDGLCAEGAWEAAMGALAALDLRELLDHQTTNPAESG